jgi:hypothetical protein
LPKYNRRSPFAHTTSPQQLPAGIRSETLTVPAFELLESSDYGVNAAISGVLQRATAKWREARAEDHSRIDEVGIVDDVLA